MAMQGHVVGLPPFLATGHLRLEGHVDDSLNGGQRAEAGGQVQHISATTLQLSLDALIEDHVGAPKAVDRLFGIAHDEELPRNGTGLEVAVAGRIIRRDEQQDLGLKRIGILELVHEQVRKSLLQVATHGRLVAHHVAHADEHVEVVERPRSLLEILVRHDHLSKHCLQARSQIRFRIAHEGLERFVHGLPAVENFLPRQPLAVALAGAFAFEGIAIADELAKLVLEPVVVTFAHALALLHLLGETLQRNECAGQVVTPALGPVHQSAHVPDLGHQVVDPGLPLERRTRPGRVEVPPLHELFRRAEQHVPGALSRGPSPRGEHASKRLGGIVEHGLVPLVERTLEQRTRLGDDLEGGIDRGLDRALPQQIEAERVDRADVGGLQRFESRFEARALGVAGGRVLPFAFELAPEAELHLARRLVGEGDGDDTVEGRFSTPQQARDSAYELGGLPRSGCRFHHERGGEVLADSSSRVGILEGLGHFSSLIRPMAAISTIFIFRAVRCSSRGPQTDK